MPEIDIVLVEPLYEGNVGFAARVMKNFGFHRLVLINPCKLGNEADGRASHAQDVLQGAEVCTIEDVFARSNIVIATTGTVSKSVCHAMRMPFYSPKELRERIQGCGRAYLDPLRAGELGAQQRGGEAQRYDLHDPDRGGVPDPQSLACGRCCLLRTLKPAAAQYSLCPPQIWSTCTGTSTGTSMPSTTRSSSGRIR